MSLTYLLYLLESSGYSLVSWWWTAREVEGKLIFLGQAVLPVRGWSPGDTLLC